MIVIRSSDGRVNDNLVDNARFFVTLCLINPDKILKE